MFSTASVWSDCRHGWHATRKNSLPAICARRRDHFPHGYLMNSRWQVGIDIGGTFTDVVAFQPSTGEIAQAKVRSHPDDPVAGLLAALEAVGIPWERVDDLMHGTTLVTNAIVEDRLDEGGADRHRRLCRHPRYRASEPAPSLSTGSATQGAVPGTRASALPSRRTSRCPRRRVDAVDIRGHRRSSTQGGGFRRQGGGRVTAACLC